MSQYNALIIDDEPDIRELLEITLLRMGIETRSSSNLEDAKALLHQHSFDICLTDMKLPDGNGLDFVDYIQNEKPDLPVAVITAHGNIESAVRALKSGAFDFISKPVDLNALRNIISSALKLPNTQASQSNNSNTKQLLGDSPALEALRQKIHKVSRSQAHVYINGESGTGKELVANLIHDMSARHDKPFIPVNCSAIPNELMESEFFGHKKGSFTGASQDKDGLFVAANQGTLFLDEVADLPIAMQVKLLRAIQEGTVRAVGSNEENSVDVRILSATHKDLEQLVENGSFRQDLFYRINVIKLDVPPLRNRPQDTRLLTGFFLSKLSDKYKRKLDIHTEAMQALLSHAFPGNVRELENILERAVTLADSDTINIGDLQLPASNSTTPTIPTQTDTLSSVPNVAPNSPLDNALETAEKASIVQALEQTRWNKTEAAKLLGISFRQLRYRIKKFNIE